MNKITKGLLDDFCQAQQMDASIDEATAFEYFSAHLVISSISETTSTTTHTVVGEDAQLSVDIIGVIVNGNLIENEDEIDAFISINNYLDVDFVFAQAKTSENFEVSVLGELGEFADNFIEDDKCSTDTKKFAQLRAIKNKIYKESKYFRRRNPNAHIYYVTTGIQPENDRNFTQKTNKIIKNFAIHSNTKQCFVNLVGAKEIQQLKRQLDHSIAREISFSRKVPLPQTPGIDEAYLGVVSAPTFISLLKGPGSNMLSSIFYDNVRDWQGDNTVNSGIAKTLSSPEGRARFVFMNNGITIIAKKVQTTGDKVLLEDYQIVNGCQTSNVLWNHQNGLDESTLIPMRIVATTNETVVRDIIKATNSQTQVSESQLLAATDFQKQLELYLQAQGQPLYYERRSRQFANSSIDRARIVTPISLMKAYASIVLQEPHKTTRDFQSVLDQAGTSIFGEKHKLELYYMTALAQYWIEHFLRKGIIDRGLTVARFQILLAFRLLNEKEGMPPVESNKAKKWANDLALTLEDQQTAQAHLQAAAAVVDHIISTKKNKRDAARASTFTDEVISEIKKIKSKASNKAIATVASLKTTALASKKRVSRTRVAKT